MGPSAPRGLVRVATLRALCRDIVRTKTNLTVYHNRISHTRIGAVIEGMHTVLGSRHAAQDGDVVNLSPSAIA